MDFNSLKYNTVRLIKMSPSKLIRKAASKIIYYIINKTSEIIDMKRDTHVKSSFKCLYSYINPEMLDVTMIDLKAASFLLDMYLRHYFDLLGSGFVKVNYNLIPAGVEGIKYDSIYKIKKFDLEGEWLSNIILKPHLNYSQKIWNRIGEKYEPINWQMDFKSGFCYSAKVWYKRQPVGRYKGSDIKVPWELSRMQHLPELAVFSLLFPDKKDAIINEFRNEILDFCMANPVKMGANWACTMDTAIRASNMLIAYDILHSIDDADILDDEFTNFFANFIFEHGNFIIHNLEWENGKNCNHYLSDICGLLFISAYLERNETTDAWLAFSIQELISCMENQFNNDGTNFEGSTSYHRLSGELLAYSTALIYGLLKTDKNDAIKIYNHKRVKRLLPFNRQKFNFESENFFPEEYLQKLFMSALFTKDIIKPNGNITQIGDNDSGRFFKLSPAGEFKGFNELIAKYKNLSGYKGINGIDEYFDENILNHSAFISAVDGLFDFEGFRSFSSRYPLEKSIIKSLSENYYLDNDRYTSSNRDIIRELSNNHYLDTTRFNTNNADTFRQLSNNHNFNMVSSSRDILRELSNNHNLDITRYNSSTRETFRQLSNNHNLDTARYTSSNRNALRELLNNYYLNMTELNIKHKTKTISNKNNMIFNKKTVIIFRDYTDRKINIDEIKLIIYPVFGLYIYKADGFYLTVFAGNINKIANRSHLHNDKLSFELNLSGQDIYFDPGTYLYTPVPEIRDKFRSTIVHNTVMPLDDCEQNSFIGLSDISNETACKIINLQNTSIEVELSYRDICIRRKFTIKSDCLEISDSCNKDFISNLNDTVYTNGYGKLINEHWLRGDSE